MTKSFFEKRDFKALTTLSAFSVTEKVNEDNQDGAKNNIIFITSFGYVSAKSIASKTIEEPKAKEDYLKYFFQKSLETRDEMMKEHGNEDLLIENTSFILENVEIRSFTGGVTTLPTMILFSDAILGISSGHLD